MWNPASSMAATSGAVASSACPAIREGSKRSSGTERKVQLAAARSGADRLGRGLLAGAGGAPQRAEAVRFIGARSSGQAASHTLSRGRVALGVQHTVRRALAGGTHGR